MPNKPPVECIPKYDTGGQNKRGRGQQFKTCSKLSIMRRKQQKLVAMKHKTKIYTEARDIALKSGRK